MRYLRLCVVIGMIACSGQTDKNGDDTEQNDTNDIVDTDVQDTGSVVDETDSIAEGREQPFIQCAGGGFVEGATYSGSICFAPVDLSSGSTSASRNYQWQAGPTLAVSP